MKRDLGEHKTPSNLIQPSPLRVTIILKQTWTIFLALILLSGALYGFLPPHEVLANSEGVFLARAEYTEHTEDTEQADGEYLYDQDEEPPAEHPAGIFSVRPILPESQISPGVRHFHLETHPGEEQFVSVRFENLTGEYQTVEVAIHLATTDQQGRVNYFGSNEPPDATLPHNIEDLVSFNPFVQLEPYETVEFWMTIRMPETPFQGVLAGGLTFTLAEDVVPPIMMAMLLVQGEPVEPQLMLADANLEVVGGQSVVNALLRNATASFAGELTITTEVRDNAGNLVFTNTRDGIHMAPNSSFTYEVGLDGIQMSSESYEVTFLIEEEQGEDGYPPRRWPLTLSLYGTGTAVAEVEEAPPEPVQEEVVEEEEEALPEPPPMLDEESIYNILLLLMAIAGIFVLVAIIVSIVRKNRTKSDDFMELQEQILATLMSDEEEEEAEIRPIKRERQVPIKAREEQVGDRISEPKERAPHEKARPSDKIEKKDKNLEKKEREIARKQRELEEKERLLRAKEKSIEEKEKTVEEKKKELEKKEQEKKERLAEKVRKIERKREEWEIDI